MSRAGHAQPKSTIFLDDRSFVCQTQAQAHAAIDAWQQLAHAVGMKENAGKTKILVRANEKRQELRASSPSLAKFLVSQVRILGVDFCDNRRSAVRPTQLARRDQAKRRAVSLLCIPLSRQWYTQKVISLVTSVSSWGVWLVVSSLSLSFSDYLPTYLSSMYLSIYLALYLSLSLFHLITYLPIYLSIYLSI